MLKWLKNKLGVPELQKQVSQLKRELREINSVQKDFEWKMNRGVSGRLESFEDLVCWRKVTKKLDGWKKEAEFIELFAHVYVLDKGYRKVLPPYLKSDSKGNVEVDKKEWLNKEWDGSYELRCYMVSRLVIPGYFKVEDFLSNNSDNFTFEKMFGRNRKELVNYMEQYNFQKKDDDMYSLNFYEL